MEGHFRSWVWNVGKDFSEEDRKSLDSAHSILFSFLMAEELLKTCEPDRDLLSTLVEFGLGPVGVGPYRAQGEEGEAISGPEKPGLLTDIPLE